MTRFVPYLTLRNDLWFLGAQTTLRHTHTHTCITRKSALNNNNNTENNKDNNKTVVRETKETIHQLYLLVPLGMVHTRS